jgi:hypothetical protein
VEVFVDDKKVAEAFPGGGAVEDALHHVQATLCAPGQVVVGLRCDGEVISNGAMGAILRKPASSFERLEVFTGDRKALVIDAMGQASACLTETAGECRHVADLLTEGRIAEGAEVLGECLRIWQQIHEGVARSIEMLQLDPAGMAINGEPMVDVISRPKEALLQVRDALRAQDYVLLADLLQYEFQEVTDRWHSILTKIRREAEDLADRPPPGAA